MTTTAYLEKIADIEGVSQYLLLGPSGQLLAHKMDNHIIMSSMTISCASICKLIKDEHFQYLVFAQEDDRDFFIFPVGSHYLAVLKEAEYPAQDFTRNIASFISNATSKLARKGSVSPAKS
jgi:hypothetical protein